MGPGSASQSWPCTPPARSSTLPGCTRHKCPVLTNPAGFSRMLLQEARWAQTGACPGTYSPPSLQRDKHELPRPPTSSEGLPTSPASLRCVPSHKDLCQNKCESLAACGRSCAGLKYSIHMVKSDQMQLFLLTSYTHAGRFSIQLF